jgi:hypothetical protein
METLKIYTKRGYSVYEVTDIIEAFDWKRIAEEISFEDGFASLKAVKEGNNTILIEKLPDDEITVVASMSNKLYNATVGYFKNNLKKTIKKAMEDHNGLYDVEPYMSVDYDDETDTIEIMIEDEDGMIVNYMEIENVEGIDLLVEDAFIDICDYFGF